MYAVLQPWNFERIQMSTPPPDVEGRLSALHVYTTCKHYVYILFVHAACIHYTQPLYVYAKRICDVHIINVYKKCMYNMICYIYYMYIYISGCISELQIGGTIMEQ